MAQDTTTNFNNDFIKPDDANQYSADGLPTLDIKHGGQWGALPAMGALDNGASINEWMHDQQYLKRDLIPIVISVPKMFELFPNTDSWKQAVKAMLEVHAKTIDGLNSSLSVNKTDKELGLSGAKFEEVSDVTRESSSVAITVDEKYGNPFEILLDVWIRYGLLDPDLKAPLITRIASEDLLPNVWSPEWYAMSAIFIEPDVLLRKPIHAWLVNNMFPDANPDITGKKDKNSGRDGKTISITLGGFAIPHTNKRVMKLAKQVLTNLELWNKDPEDMLLPVDKIDESIANVDGVNIYYDGIKPGTDSNAQGVTGSATPAV